MKYDYYNKILVLNFPPLTSNHAFNKASRLKKIREMKKVKLITGPIILKLSN